MAWTDADYKFAHIDVGAYGNSSDSEIFKSSQMGKLFIENRHNIPSGQHLPYDCKGPVMPFYVVGDEWPLTFQVTYYSKKSLLKEKFELRKTYI